jgi:hypothetical protein
VKFQALFCTSKMRNILSYSIKCYVCWRHRMGKSAARPRYSYFLSTYIYAWLEFVRGTLRDFILSSYERDKSYSFKNYIMYL